MAEREDIEQVVRKAYGARMRGDIDAIMQLFEESVDFRLAGSAGASPIAVHSLGAPAFRELLAEMIRVFEWLDHKIVALVIDGDRVAVHSRARMRSTITGDTVDTELMDLLQVRNGRITSFLQFCDTALAARLMQK